MVTKFLVNAAWIAGILLWIIGGLYAARYWQPYHPEHQQEST